MPTVPGFQYDLFVSYAHRNDAPWKEGGVGWVSEFVRTIRSEMEARNRAFRMWFDPQLRTGDDFNAAICDAISASAVFLSILSPAYDDCPYCKKEVIAFREQRHPAFGMRIGSLSRIQGVLLQDLAEDRWPPELRTTSPCRFFSEDVARFNKPAEPDENHPYVRGVWKVVDSLAATLDEMRRRKEQGTVIEHSYEVQGDPSVYLADVPDDLYYKRESLRTTLQQLKNFQVFTMPETAVLTGPAVLSVHLFGAIAGRPATGNTLPLSRLQLDAALAANPARRPLVWMARDLKMDAVEPTEHRQFLDSLQIHNGIELVRSGFEDLKDEIVKRMLPRSAPVKTVRRVREDPIVYIWHQVVDPTPLGPLKQTLKQNNCGISVFPYADVPPEKLQSKLAFCDGLVVPYTLETKSTAEEMMTCAFQLRRREERPIAFAAVELPPTAGADFNFEHPRVVPVHHRPDGSFQGLDQFLARLEEEDV